MAAVPASAQSSQPQALPTIETKPNPKEYYLSKLFPPPATVYDMIIQVIVGKDAPRTFQVHKGLLCHFSEYFARFFNNENWQESEDGVVRLVVDDAQTIQLFYNWFYTGHIRDDTKTNPKTAYEISKITPDDCIRLVSEDTRSRFLDQQRCCNDAVLVAFRQLGLLAAFADMRIVSALADTVASLAIQKVMTEGRLAVQSLRDLDEVSPPSSDILTSLSIIVAELVNLDELITQLKSLPATVSRNVIQCQRFYFESALRGEFRVRRHSVVVTHV